MAKYLVQASYTREGVQGLLKEGGTSRRRAIEQLLKGLGATLEAFYFAFGDNDVVTIVDGPDNVTTAAVMLAINASGAVTTKTTVLLTPEEIDAATKKSISFRPPGQ